MEVDQAVAQEKICQALRDAVSSMNSAGGSASSRMEEESAEEDDGETMLPALPALPPPFNNEEEEPDVEAVVSMNHEYISSQILPDNIENTFPSVDMDYSIPEMIRNPSTPKAVVTPSNAQVQALPFYSSNGVLRNSDDDFEDLFDGELLRSSSSDDVFAFRV